MGYEVFYEYAAEPKKDKLTLKFPQVTKTEFFSHNINIIWSRQVMRIKNNISEGIISWSNTKFSKLTSHDLYMRQ